MRQAGPLKALASFYSVEPSKIIILHDELDIPYAAIRAKLAGGDNGHNGLKSLTSSLGTADYLSSSLRNRSPYGRARSWRLCLSSNLARKRRKSLDEFIDRGADVCRVPD
jgi:peptidyl-tRNA hydrolase, PTH1 family